MKEYKEMPKWILNKKYVSKTDAWTFIIALILIQFFFIPISAMAYTKTYGHLIPLVIYLISTFIFLGDRGKK